MLVSREKSRPWPAMPLTCPRAPRVRRPCMLLCAGALVIALLNAAGR